MTTLDFETYNLKDILFTEKMHQLGIFNMQPTTINVPQNFVATLRRSGIKIRVRHYRWVIDCDAIQHSSDNKYLALVQEDNRRGFIILGRGGRTEVDVTMQNGETFSEYATCSEEDTYDKRLGVYLAATRALKRAKEAGKKDVK